MTQFLAHSVFHTPHKRNLEKSSLNTVPLNLPVTRHCECAFESVLICMNDCTLDPFSVAQQNGLSFFRLVLSLALSDNSSTNGRTQTHPTGRELFVLIT